MQDTGEAPASRGPGHRPPGIPCLRAGSGPRRPGGHARLSRTQWDSVDWTLPDVPCGSLVCKGPGEAEASGQPVCPRHPSAGHQRSALGGPLTSAWCSGGREVRPAERPGRAGREGPCRGGHKQPGCTGVQVGGQGQRSSREKHKARQTREGSGVRREGPKDTVKAGPGEGRGSGARTQPTAPAEL